MHKNQWENGKLLKWAVGCQSQKHFSFHPCSSASFKKNEERLVENRSLGWSNQLRKAWDGHCLR